MTNADKIRAMSAMTDEEIAEMYGVELDCVCCDRMTGGCGKPATTYARCINHWLNWLQKEADE